ncbi:MAG: Gfo/Idh/MocA family oxidoreductase [Opitutaceae bacterium]
MSIPQSDRRKFLKTVSAAGLAALTLPTVSSVRAAGASAPRRKGTSVMGLRATPLDVVRCGFIGIGERGMGTLRSMMLFKECEVRALCDNHKPTLASALDLVANAGRPAPAAYGDSDEAWLKMVERDDIDAVFICTPWRLHVPMAVAAMRAGKHAFIEVPAAVTLEECWQLVDAAEETQRHCMMLENVCYGREELMVLRMCREGVFGELVHGEGSYLHDLREQAQQIEHGAGSWRIREHELRDGNLYPTHGLGPVAQYMSINRGDRFSRLVSFSSPSLGLQDYVARNFPPGSPRRKATYICGDMNTAIVKTARGRTIVVQHDTMNARPYSRTNMIQGTRGIFAGYPNRIYIEGRSPEEHQWEMDLAKWFEEFDHPLWTKVTAEVAQRSIKEPLGHGGMDFVMRWRIMQCLREGLPLDQDVYDAAAWSAIGPLTEDSVARDGAPVEAPDFTRGAWKHTAPLGIVS